MRNHADGLISVQTSAEGVPSTPSWFGEVVLLIEHLRQQGVLATISKRVRFVRRRFGHYEIIDFLAVLFGYAISGERTLEAFYERVRPFAVPFMALFERDRLPARSTLSRFLTALTQEPVEALRAIFLDDLLCRPLWSGSEELYTGSLTDRAGTAWMVFDLDGTREAARQRALPQTEALPPLFRRLDKVCAAGYPGRKRGQVVRTRTVISQAHSYQWLGSFGNRGNGRYREELRQGLAAIMRYLTTHQLPRRAPCSDSTDNMAQVRCSLICWALLLSPVARSTRHWITPGSRRACSCPLISSSSVRKATGCAPSMRQTEH